MICLQQEQGCGDTSAGFQVGPTSLIYYLPTDRNTYISISSIFFQKQHLLTI